MDAPAGDALMPPEVSKNKIELMRFCLMGGNIYNDIKIQNIFSPYRHIGKWSFGD
jgi:hypothetical protein